MLVSNFVFGSLVEREPFALGLIGVNQALAYGKDSRPKGSETCHECFGLHGLPGRSDLRLRRRSQCRQPAQATWPCTSPLKALVIGQRDPFPPIDVLQKSSWQLKAVVSGEASWILGQVSQGSRSLADALLAPVLTFRIAWIRLLHGT